MLATLLSTQDGDRLCTGVPPSCNQQGTHCSPTSTTQGGIDQETVRTKQTSTLWPRFFSPPPTSPNNIKVPALPKPTQKSLNKPQPSPWAIPSFPDRHPQSEGWGVGEGWGGWERFWLSSSPCGSGQVEGSRNSGESEGPGIPKWTVTGTPGTGRRSPEREVSTRITQVLGNQITQVLGNRGD